MKTIIVTIPGMIQEEDWAKLSQVSIVDYVEREKLSTPELLDVIAGYDFLMLNRDVVDELGEDFYSQLKERGLPLKAISADITGMSWAHPEIAKKYDMPLMNTPDYSTVSVAEFSLALLLMMVKNMHRVWRARLEDKEEVPLKNDVLQGKTVGIVGLGHIGSKLAELLSGLSVNIIGWDRKDKSIPNVTQLSLEELMKQSDYVSLHLTTTDETRGIINEQLLSIAKPGQIIINEADGPLVDNDAMLRSIENGTIAGYACANGAVQGHGLQNNPNVVTMPAQAWFTEHSLTLLREIWVGNVIAAIDAAPRNQV